MNNEPGKVHQNLFLHNRIGQNNEYLYRRMSAKVHSSSVFQPYVAAYNDPISLFSLGMGFQGMV